jgi:NAD(P)-dependent dehydrogenase (short-subunit alcohol dehydrogenase family)
MRARLPDRFGAVVTGGGSGLGRALAIQLARRGGRVVVADVAREGSEHTVELVRAAGGAAWFAPCDVGDWAQVEELARRARAWVGDVDLIANNAGVVAGGLVGEVPLQDWRWTVDVSLWGAIHGCHAFLPGMRARRRGWLLNVASAAGYACLARFGPYSVAKAGVIALSETLRAELDPREVAVTVVCPSFFQTGIADAARGDDPETRAMARQLMGRATTTADDVARHAIASLEAGRLYAIPTLEAHAVRWARRIAPGSVHRLTNLGRAVLRRMNPR